MRYEGKRFIISSEEVNKESVNNEISWNTLSIKFLYYDIKLWKFNIWRWILRFNNKKYNCVEVCEFQYIILSYTYN